MRKPDYDRGFRDGIRAAVTWLHEQASKMNDWHARQLYNGAAFNLGSDFSPTSGRALDARESGAESRTAEPIPKVSAEQVPE